MVRLIFYILALAILVVGSVWFADRPGAVTIEWMDWRLDTSVPILLLAIAIVVGVLLAVYRVLRWTVRTPLNLTVRQRALRQRRGYQALAHGLAAAAAGQGKEARRLAARAERMLGDRSLTGVLSAQAAHLVGDKEGAQTHYAALLEHPETAALGLRGLLRDAISKGETESGIDLATRARKLTPRDPALAETLYELLVAEGRHKDAEALVDDARKKGAMTVEVAARRKAVMAHERARLARDGGDHSTAFDHAKRAVKHDPGFSIASAALALQHIAGGEKRRATKVLNAAWKRSPGPELLAAAHRLVENEEPLARVRKLEKITADHPDHPDTHRALGEAALAAKLWGEARRHLMAAMQSRPTQGIFRLLARLEEQEFGDQAAARTWLDKAAQAPSDAGWACTKCGTPAAEWSLTCPSCGAVDSLAWVAHRAGAVDVEPAKTG